MGKQLIRVFWRNLLWRGYRWQWNSRIKPVGYIICSSWYPLILWRKKAGKGYAGKNIVYSFK